MAAVGAIRWQLGVLPTTHTSVPAEQWWQLQYQQILPIAEDFEQLRLQGDPRLGAGSGVRWQFDRLQRQDAADIKLALQQPLGGSTA